MVNYQTIGAIVKGIGIFGGVGSAFLTDYKAMSIGAGAGLYGVGVYIQQYGKKLEEKNRSFDLTKVVFGPIKPKRKDLYVPRPSKKDRKYMIDGSKLFKKISDL